MFIVVRHTHHTIVAIYPNLHMHIYIYTHSLGGTKAMRLVLRGTRLPTSMTISKRILSWTSLRTVDRPPCCRESAVDWLLDLDRPESTSTFLGGLADIHFVYNLFAVVVNLQSMNWQGYVQSMLPAHPYQGRNRCPSKVYPLQLLVISKHQMLQWKSNFYRLFFPIKASILIGIFHLPRLIGGGCVCVYNIHMIIYIHIYIHHA